MFSLTQGRVRSCDQLLVHGSNLLTFGLWEGCKQRKLEEFMAAGDFTVWPFVRRQDYDLALAKPRFFEAARLTKRTTRTHNLTIKISNL